VNKTGFSVVRYRTATAEDHCALQMFLFICFMSSVSQQFRRLISDDFETAVFWVLLRSCIVQNAACNNCRVKNFLEMPVVCGVVYMIAEGVEHPDCVAVPEFVRGKNYPCAIICFRVPG